MKIKLNLFEILVFGVTELVFFSLILALMGVFYKALIIFILVMEGVVLIYLLKKKIIIIEKMKKFDFMVLIFLIIVSLTYTLSVEPTIYGGRDEGSFTASGVLLAKNHGLVHSDNLITQFGSIYQNGKALNFPGFYYHTGDSIKSQFLPGFFTWIGVNYSIFSFSGLRLINFLPLIIFGFSFYLVLKNLTQNKIYSLLGLLILLTFPVIFILFKFSLSEIFFASFLWFSIYLLIKYFKNKSYINYFLAVYSLILLPFIRIEAVIIIPLVFLLFLIFDFANFRNKKYYYLFLIPIAAIIISIFTSPNFFIDTFKGVLEVENNTEQSDDALLGEEGFSFIPDDWEDFYLPKVLLNYGVLPLLIIFIIEILARLKRLLQNFKISKNNFFQHLNKISKKDKLKLVPFIVLGLTFYYIIDPNISNDHPWMLRRFAFSVIPASLVYSLIFFKNIKLRNILGFIFFSGIMAYNIYLIIPFWNFSQNQGLYEDFQKLSSRFDQDDLVLVSQQSSASQWSLLSEPLRIFEGLEAVYFFNPNDLKKLDLQDFDKVYLLAQKKELDLYQEIVDKKASGYNLDYKIVKPLKSPFAKPQIQQISMEGNIYLIKK
ncbi:MAG: hypothetical protein GF335_05195 [Candidatus Moranbacteria bacterium]|nr:hypothetical protein [Candidatus Moranbacteria bacterium]